MENLPTNVGVAESLQDLQRELRETRRNSEESRLEHRRELFKLRSSLTSLNKQLEDKMACSRVPQYQQAIRNVFLRSDTKRSGGGSGTESFESSSLLPQPYVIKIQAQLCHSLHSNEIQKKQLQISERRNNALTKHMEKRKEELSDKCEVRKRVLDKRLEDRTLEWSHELEELQLKAEAQEITIQKLRKLLNLGDSRSCDSILRARFNSKIPISPRTLVSSFSTSMRKVVDGVSLFTRKEETAPPSLEITMTPPQVPKSKVPWIDLTKNKCSNQKLEESSEQLQILQGSPSQSNFSRHSIGRNSNWSNECFNGGGDSSFVVNSIIDSFDKLDPPEKSNRKEITRSIGFSIRNLMTKGPGHHGEEYSSFESLTIIEDEAFETPTGERDSLSTEIGKALLTLAICDDDALTSDG